MTTMQVNECDSTRAQNCRVHICKSLFTQVIPQRGAERWLKLSGHLNVWEFETLTSFDKKAG